MNNCHQLELFSDGAWAAAAARQSPASPRPTEADLQAKLDAARARLHEIAIIGMKTSLPAKMLAARRDAEAWQRREVRLHFQVLERFREEHRE
jgi:hypothetical protein